MPTIVCSTTAPCVCVLIASVRHKNLTNHTGLGAHAHTTRWMGEIFKYLYVYVYVYCLVICKVCSVLLYVRLIAECT